LAAELLAGRTVLLVTHHPLEALRLADRIWVLAGRPASLQGPILPKGERPRDPGGLLALQSELMQALLDSAEQTEAA
jgi:putative hydroxymethylpyrimidine transport system ATP-binding protein